MAGVTGIGPVYLGFRVQCLTTWLHPKALPYFTRITVARKGEHEFEIGQKYPKKPRLVFYDVFFPKRLPLPYNVRK